MSLITKPLLLALCGSIFLSFYPQDAYAASNSGANSDLARDVSDKVLHYWSNADNKPLSNNLASKSTNDIESISDNTTTSMLRVSKGYQVDLAFGDLYQTLLSKKSSLEDDLDNSSSVLAKNITTQNGWVDVSVPLPNGEFAVFRLTESKVMSPKLAAKFPDIVTYTGYQVGGTANKSEFLNNRGRFDISENGFNGVFNNGNQLVYIDPIAVGQTETYLSYYKQDVNTPIFNDTITRLGLANKGLAPSAQKAELDNADQAVTTYRLAVAATAEYTQFHGGTVQSGLAALVTMVNRLNQVFLTELAIQFELVDNNDLLIFTDAATDPYDNNDNDGAVNTTQINNRIGVENYDIGHVVTTGAGGLAVLGALCQDTFKAYGVTGLNSPVGDAFWVDYVSHEIGHQLGAEHTFNGTSGSCGGSRASSAAYEPGGGNTIMAYAGICGSQNIANAGIDQFHSHSLDEMNGVMAARSCGTVAAATNRIPAVDAGSNYTIPAQTPFTLNGTASDLDGDTLSYEWQQFDLGIASNSRSDDNTDFGDGPLFRVFPRTDSTSRTFPQLTDILSGNLTYGETYPTTNRELNFRFIARDNEGGVNYDEMQVTVVDTGEAFALSSPIGGETWQTREQQVSWNLANTHIGPISCSQVDISLSTDGGNSFPTMLAEATSNDGEETVMLPNESVAQARIKVACRDNVFFAISPNNFSVDINYIAITGQQAITINEDESITLSTDLFIFDGAEPDELEVAAGDNYTVSGLQVSPSSNYFGTLNVPIRAVVNGQQSSVFNALITVNSVNDLPVAVNDQLTVTQGADAELVDVVANDSDIESAVLTLASFDYNGTGSVQIVDNQIQYQSDASFSGQDTVTYIVSDDDGGQATGQLTITVQASSSDGGSGGSGSGTGGDGGDNGAGNSGSSSGGGSFGALLVALLAVFGVRRFSSFPSNNQVLNSLATGLIMLGLLSACSQETSSSTNDDIAKENSPVGVEQTLKTELQAAIDKARAEQDTRLYVTAGRRVTIPGAEQYDPAVIEERCGYKYMEGVSDVIRSEQEAEQRKQRIAFMTAYNQAIVKTCLN